MFALSKQRIIFASVSLQIKQPYRYSEIKSKTVRVQTINKKWKMKIYSYIYLLLLAGICSCSTKESDHAFKKYVFDNSSCIEVENVIADLKTRSIYLSDSVIVRENSFIVSDGEFYYIYFKEGSAPAFRFDSDGEFVNQIGSIGNGPKEFTLLADLSLNAVDRTVEILSYEFIYKYTYDGEFIERKSHNPYRRPLFGLW